MTKEIFSGMFEEVKEVKKKGRRLPAFGQL